MGANKSHTPVDRLGDLEADVMGVVWEKGQATVQEVQEALEPRRPLAYTTVMTVMSRLAGKGLLKQSKLGRGYVYSPKASQEKLARSMLRSLVRRFYNGAAAKAITHLLETDEQIDEAELSRLEALIRAKRGGGKK